MGATVRLPFPTRLLFAKIDSFGAEAPWARNEKEARMRAVTIVDGELEIHDHPDPEPGPGEVLVRVRAAGINRGDLHQRQGFYPAPPGSPPDIPGMELAGDVVAVGRKATRFAPGERVMALVGGGAQAELAVVHERIAMPVPDGMDWPAAGGFAEA